MLATTLPGAALRLGGLALLFVGCGADTGTPDHLLQTVATVGSAGATLELPGGLSLVIPPGALARDVQIGMELLPDLADAGVAAPSFFDGAPAISIALTPHGTTFAMPITLKLPFVGDAANLVLMRADDARDATWEAVGPITVADGIATVRIDHFSLFTAGQVAAGSCPCWNGAVLEAFLKEGRRATGKEPEARFAIRVSPAPDPIFCAVRPGSPDCGPAGEQSYLTSLIFREATFYAYPTVEGTIAADNTTLVGSASCETRTIGEASTVADYERYWPDAPGTPTAPAWTRPGSTQSAIFALTSAAQIRACHALVTRSATKSAAQLGYYAVGLPAGEALEVGQAGQPPVALITNDTLVWDFSVVDVGASYTVQILRQPASAVCSVTLGALTGTLTANTILEFTCAKPPDHEVCNGKDDDANGATDEGFDGDTDHVTTCGPDGIPGNADDDCNDTNAAIRPGAVEVCDTFDNDCDTHVDNVAAPNISIVSGFANPPELTKESDAQIVVVADPFSGTTLDTDLWNSQVSGDAMLVVQNGELDLVATSTTTINPPHFGLSPGSQGQTADLSSGTANGSITVQFGLGGSADFDGVQFSLQVFNQHSGEGAYAYVGVAANGTATFRTERGTSGTPAETITLSSSVLNTLSFTYDKTSGAGTFTLTDGAGAVHTSVTQGSAFEPYVFYITADASPNGGTGQPIVARITDVTTNASFTIPAQYHLSGSPLTLDGTAYSDLPGAAGGVGALWLAGDTGAGAVGILAAGASFPYGGTDAVAQAYFVTVTENGVTKHVTIVSPLDRATLLTALTGPGVTVVVDGSFPAFTRNGLGAYLFALPAGTCPSTFQGP